MKEVTVKLYTFAELELDVQERLIKEQQELESRYFEPQFITEHLEHVAKSAGVEASNIAWCLYPDWLTITAGVSLADLHGASYDYMSPEQADILKAYVTSALQALEPWGKPLEVAEMLDLVWTFRDSWRGQTQHVENENGVYSYEDYPEDFGHEPDYEPSAEEIVKLEKALETVTENVEAYATALNECLLNTLTAEYEYQTSKERAKEILEEFGEQFQANGDTL